MTTESVGDATVLGRRTPAAEMSRAAVAVRWFIGTAGFVALFVLILVAPPFLNYRHLALFTVAMALADYFFLVRIAPASYFSIAPAFLFAYLLTGGGIAASIAGLLAKVIVTNASVIRGKRMPTPLFQLFAHGEFLLSILGGTLAATLTSSVLVFQHPVLRNPFATLIIFAIGYFISHAAITTLAAWSRAGRAEVRNQLWPADTKWTAISVLASIPFAAAILFMRYTIGYTAATLMVLALMGGIALIIRLNVNLRRGNDELKAINRIGNLINATLDLPEMFRIIARESRLVLPWDGFFIAIGDRDSKEIQIVFMTGSGNEVAQRTIPQGAGLTGRAIQTGELIHYERNEASRNDEAEQESRTERSSRSIVVAPMKFGDRVIGAISVQSMRTDVYGKPQMRLLQTIAGQAAIAVRNAQLFQSEEQANRERDEFLSLVTHEIKNPLASIQGYTDLADVSLSGGDAESARESLGVIRMEAKRILRLTEDLLDASKMSEGKFALQLAEVDVAKLVHQLVSRYRGITTQPIETIVDESIPPVQADDMRLMQVLDNLLSNAVKYSRRSGAIEVELRAVAASVRLAVKDSGEGIPAEKLPLLFERYYRVEEGDQTVKGTGLGLFISREIIRMHGGNISVESVPGRGTTFTVELPFTTR
jgi:signal transduction histidine kinase